MARPVKPATGLYRNGARWWVRTVRSPASGRTRSLSTVTTDVKDANAIAAMLNVMKDAPRKYAHWLEAAVTEGLPLDTLYHHYAAGTLDTLAEQRADVDLEPWVGTWIAKHLASSPITEDSRGTYARQVRYFIPEGAPFSRSRLTEDYIRDRLAELEHGRGGGEVSSSTKRRYIVSLQLFIKYARKRVPLTTDPLIGAEWLPKNGPARSTHWEHARRVAVLVHMTGEHRAAAALMLGSGIELGALLAMTYADVGSNAERTVVAHGTKNVHRQDRTIFVDAWAWAIFREHVGLGMPGARVWSYNPANTGRELREAFYAAQVAAGLIAPPVVSETTGKPMWSDNARHTLHDCRHTYAINRALGLDGEEPQGTDFIAAQLGHADEQMVVRVYKKANVVERARLLTRQRAAKAAGAK